MRNDKQITILVSTCHAFDDLWENNSSLLNKHWSCHPSALYFTDTSSRLGFNVLECGEVEFGDRLLLTLKEVKTKYVFLTLDDYLICKDVKSQVIDEIIDFMDIHDADYYRLFKKAAVKGPFIWKYKTKRLPLTMKAYEVNFYPSIWKTASLVEVLKKNENIWKCEVRLTRRSRENGFNCFCSYDKSIFPFIDTIRKGKYLRPAYRFLKKNSLYISNRNVRGLRETALLNFRTFLVSVSPAFFIDLLKKISKKTYYSDWADTDD